MPVTITETVERWVTPDDEEPILTHYAPRHLIVDAMVYGTPIKAICGKVWVPSRDPNLYPVCPPCRQRLIELSGT